MKRNRMKSADTGVTLANGSANGKIRLSIRADLKQKTRYSDEERYQLFAEGKIRTHTVRKNQKKYDRNIYRNCRKQCHVY